VSILILFDCGGNYHLQGVLPFTLEEQHMPLNIEHDGGESLANDLLRGAEAIGAFIGLGLRETFYGLQEGHIPATKEGKTWVSSKRRLREHYTGFQARSPADA
jgi:hypothetical protein